MSFNGLLNYFAPQYPIHNWIGDSSSSCSGPCLLNAERFETILFEGILTFLRFVSRFANLPLRPINALDMTMDIESPRGPLRCNLPASVKTSLVRMSLANLPWPLRKPPHQKVPFRLPESGTLPFFRTWSAGCEL